MENLRIGIIGAGANTRKRHLPGLRGIEGVELCCLANRSQESAQRVAEEFSIPKVHRHWRDVIEDDEVDAVCIGTWPYLHCDATCAALEAGKDVLCEARMAMDAAEARLMLRIAQQTGRVAQIVPSPFGLKGCHVVRHLLADGYLGDVREIYVRAMTSACADPTAPLHWRHRADLSGVNVLVLGILNETVQRWFGATEAVAAQTSLFIPRRKNPETDQWDDVTSPDSIGIVARMASGAQCVYHVTGHAHHGGAMRIEAYGSEGTLVYDLADDTILAARKDDAELKPLDIPADQAGGWQVEADFIASIRDGRPVTRTNFVDGLKYMCFTEACRRSADAGRTVLLNEV